MVLVHVLDFEIEKYRGDHFRGNADIDYAGVRSSPVCFALVEVVIAGGYFDYFVGFGYYDGTNCYEKQTDTDVDKAE